jgi:hypothetical protein
MRGTEAVGDHASRQTGKDRGDHHGDKDAAETRGDVVAGPCGEEDRRQEDTLACLAEQADAVEERGGDASRTFENGSVPGVRREDRRRDVCAATVLGG